MAEQRMVKRKVRRLSRSASAESEAEAVAELSPKSPGKIKKSKERWLLTRKTWRYMADAGRRLIPDGAQNRAEDIPKIEAYFQEVCKREPRFLLWRKNSYPGALGFRKKRKDRRIGGSCRKAFSVDEVGPTTSKPSRPKDLPLYPSTSGGRFDIQKMKHDFLNSNPSTPSPSSPRSFLKDKETFPPPPEGSNPVDEEDALIQMLESYLKISSDNPSFTHGDLIDKLQQQLTITPRNIPQQPKTKSSVHFEGDHLTKSLSETLSRYYSHTLSRDRIVSDILTDRKALQKLYFDLRQTRGFRYRHSNTSPSLPWDPASLRGYKNKLSMDVYKKTIPPPLIEIQGETYSDLGVQTVPISEEELLRAEDDYKKQLAEKEEEERDYKQGHRRRSSVDNDDVSQSVSDTIKRYLRMARKKSSDSEKGDRFKRVNYDRNLRNIKAKGEITKPGDDDGLNKGCQTNDEWITTYRDLKFDYADDTGGAFNPTEGSEVVPKTHHSFLSNLLHGKHSHGGGTTSASTLTGAGAMQKSKSSSSVVHQGGRLMAKSIFKRSKSQSRAQAAQQACTWTPKGPCIWNSVSGKQVILGDTTLQHLSEIERKVLQKVALAKLQALNLGVAVKIPSETVGPVVTKKRRPYLLKRKALTTGIFDTGKKDVEKDKGPGSGLVFGIPLSQCVENDRLSRLNPTRTDDQQPRMGRSSSRASFSSLIDSTIRTDEKGSCESLSRGIAGSIPGLLDAISCGSTGDILGTTVEEDKAVPHLVNECIRHLEAYGLQTLGIFRVSSSKKRVRQLREDFDSGKETALNNDQCPHDVATLLKEFLRDLPDPLLCRDLYNAFVQTQKIRNRRLQLEAMQHLIQLLPSVNRDTLCALLQFLTIVARHSGDQTDRCGELLIGNKMNSANLATVFAPNILHSIKQGGKETSERSDDRIDVINVIRTMIDNSGALFTISSELLDEIYVHMMDSHPEALEDLLNKRDASYVDESQDEVSDGSLWSPVNTADLTLEDSLRNLQEFGEDRSKPRKTYSREEFLHESAATGGPNVAMRIRQRDRYKERSLKKRKEETTYRRREEESASSPSGSTKNKMGMAYAKARSSSLESSCSLPAENHEQSRILRIGEEQIDRRKSTPYMLNKSEIITASLTIPLNIEDDIPYIEDGGDGKQQVMIGVVRGAPTAPPRRRQRSVSSDSSGVSTVQAITGSISLFQQGYDSAIGSSVTYSSPPHNTPSSIGSSIDASGVCSSPPSWASTPPTSPDSHHTTVNYIPDDNNLPASSRPVYAKKIKELPVLQKVSYTSTSEIQRAGKPADISRESVARKKSEIQKCKSTPAFAGESVSRERFNPSITSIGNAVLRSRTADFERITQSTTEMKTTVTTMVSEKKKYTKRRYTDSRHQTRHIPDSETLDNQEQQKNASAGASQTVYKRREIISSAPTDKR